MMKVREAAAKMNASPSFVYSAISDGRLRCYRIGKGGHGGIRISEEQLHAFLQATEVNGESLPPKPAPRPIKLKHLEA
jgi:excisionase family DNA binding protein